MAKKRSSYDAYSDWYEKYSKTSEMESSKMSRQEFDKLAGAYRAAGIANPARSAAASQRVINQRQARGLSQTGGSFTEAQINTLKKAGFPVPKRFTQKWTKQNASIYYAMLQTLGISWAEAVSPEEEEAD